MISEIATKKIDHAMWVILFALAVLPWVYITTSTQPTDVLQELQSFRRELRESRAEMEGEILNRTESRLYFAKDHPNIWELIDANDLQIPAGWER